jgi:hypothetical protein
MLYVIPLDSMLTVTAPQTKLRLNLVVLYICSISVGSYYLLWTGYSPVLPNEGSNL